MMKNKNSWNVDIEIIRGFAMMWVIVIHCLYWASPNFGLTKNLITSFFLIEMPLFFFIAGASNAVGRKKSIMQFYIARLQKVLIPYWIYLLVIFVLLGIAFLVGKSTNPINAFTFNFPLIITLSNQVPPFLQWALWFIPVYALIIICFPFLKSYFDKTGQKKTQFLPLLIFSIALLCCSVVPRDHSVPIGSSMVLYWVMMCLFYIFWIYMGLFFNILEKKRTIKDKLNVIPVILLCMITLVIGRLFFHQSLNMQENKFPPNFTFLIFSFGALSLFYLLYEYILKGITFLKKNAAFSWIFDQYAKNCYSVYLYHPMAFLLLYELLSRTHTADFFSEHLYIHRLTWILFTIPVSAVLGKLFSWGEKIKIIK